MWIAGHLILKSESPLRGLTTLNNWTNSCVHLDLFVLVAFSFENNQLSLPQRFPTLSGRTKTTVLSHKSHQKTN